MAAPDDAVLKTLRDTDRGRRNLTALRAHLGTATDDLAVVLGRLLPRSADPDMAVNNLERLLAQPAARTQLPQLLESRGRGLDAVLQLLAASQFFADTLITYPEFLETLRTPPRKHPSTAELTAELRAEVDAAVARRLAQNWRLERVDATVRAMLRAGAYELTHRPDVPVEVVIDEYVELAKSFFDGPEPGFVNGALDGVARDVRT